MEQNAARRQPPTARPGRPDFGGLPLLLPRPVVLVLPCLSYATDRAVLSVVASSRRAA